MRHNGETTNRFAMRMERIDEMSKEITDSQKKVSRGHSFPMGVRLIDDGDFEFL